MSVRKPKAFTLTEMLVVISIIGVLVSMLLPAVQAAREAARRAACINNMAQCAKAIATYDSRKGFLPAARTYVSANVVQNWVVPVLPMLERQDLRDTIRSNGEDPTTVATETIPVLLCPDDPDIKNGGVLSYVVNGGRQNGTSNFDYLANGMFVDKGVLNTPATPEDKVSLDRIHDGASSTILLAENLIAGSRNQTGNPSLFWALAPAEQNSQVLWFPDLTNSDFLGLNQDLTTAGAVPSDLTRYARPASFHPGGFVISFGDNSVRFMNESVDYKIYAVLMTSYGEKAKDPRNGPPPPVQSSPDPVWQSPAGAGYPGTKF